MISFAVVEISLLFRCVLISGKQAGSVFCGADGFRLVGWANGVVFCSLATLLVPVPSFSSEPFSLEPFSLEPFSLEPGLCRPVGKHADASGFVLLDLLEHSCYNTKGRKGIEL